MTLEYINKKRPSVSPELDPCSNSNYKDFQVLNTELDISVSFDKKIVLGQVTYKLTAKTPNTTSIVLDTSYLKIIKIRINGLPSDNYELVKRKEPFGSPLKISLPTTINKEFELNIEFSTTDKCTALQFIEKEATDGQTAPYLFSQCQAIHARSLFPCFDTPGIKSPYNMKVKSPYACLMSGRPKETNEEGVYCFHQPIPIPSYLVALASGDLASAPIGPRSTVYSERVGLSDCQWEFEKDMENFIQVAEGLIFKYEWLKFDALILPLSFPYGGMENPNITFATPTLISKDRSQVKVMAHELAHSWLGNLVTNCSWEHFWLNEGWTVYLERRIIGGIAAAEAKSLGEKEAAQYGEKRRHFSVIVGWNSLVDSVKTLDPKYTSLVWNLKEGSDPDDAFSRIPYEKGFNFLFYIEQQVGGIKEFDPFIPYYFKKFRYESLDTYQFIDVLYEFFEPRGKAAKLDAIDWKGWIFGEGLPPNIPQFDPSLADECYRLVDKWVDFAKSNSTDISGFNESRDIGNFEPDQHKLFLESLTEKFGAYSVSEQIIRKLPSIYPFYAASTNGEIKSSWNELLIRFGNYNTTDQIVQDFAMWLGTVGRMKFVRPGYKLLQAYVSKEFAISTFTKFESSYHPICKTMVKKDLSLI